MSHSFNSPKLKIFSKEMISRMLISPTYRLAISDHLNDPRILSVDPGVLSVGEWADLEDASRDVFTAASPIVCIATIPPGMEDAYNDEPLPRIIGNDGVYTIWDMSGIGLYETWFTTPEAAISEAQSNWTDLIFSQGKDECVPKSSESEATPTIRPNLRPDQSTIEELRKIVCDLNLGHLIEDAMSEYEMIEPDSKFKTYVTGMAHLHRKSNFRDLVTRYVADKKSLPSCATLQKWIVEIK